MHKCLTSTPIIRILSSLKIMRNIGQKRLEVFIRINWYKGCLFHFIFKNKKNDDFGFFPRFSLIWYLLTLRRVTSWAVEEVFPVLDLPQSEAWITLTKYSSTSLVNSWPVQVCVNMKELFILSLFLFNITPQWDPVGLITA